MSQVITSYVSTAVIRHIKTQTFHRAHGYEVVITHKPGSALPSQTWSVGAYRILASGERGELAIAHGSGEARCEAFRDIETKLDRNAWTAGCRVRIAIEEAERGGSGL